MSWLISQINNILVSLDIPPIKLQKETNQSSRTSNSKEEL